MNLKSLAQKIEQKIASSSDLELALQEYDAEVGQMAIDCVKNTKIAEASIFETILNKAKDIAQRPYANTGALSAITGLGGAAAGGLLSGNLVSKKELESESDFKKRKRDTAIIGALAGGALGAGAPGLLNVSGTLGSAPAETPSLGDQISPLGVGAGALTGQGLWRYGKGWLDKLITPNTKDLIEKARYLESKGQTAGKDYWNIQRILNPSRFAANNLALPAPGQAPGKLQKIKEFLISKINSNKNFDSAARSRSASPYYALTPSGLEKFIAGGVQVPKIVPKSLRVGAGFLPAILGGYVGNQVAEAVE